MAHAVCGQDEYPIHPTSTEQVKHMANGYKVYIQVKMEQLTYAGEQEGCEIPMAVLVVPETSCVTSLKGGAMQVPFYLDTQRIDNDVEELRKAYERAKVFREERVFLIAHRENNMGIEKFIKAVRATNFVMDNLFSSDREFGKTRYEDINYMHVLVRFDLDRPRNNDNQTRNFIISKWDASVRSELRIDSPASIRVDGVHIEMSIRVTKPVADGREFTDENS